MVKSPTVSLDNLIVRKLQRLPCGTCATPAYKEQPGPEEQWLKG
jgi:hypothetical protein